MGLRKRNQPDGRAAEAPPARSWDYQLRESTLEARRKPEGEAVSLAAPWRRSHSGLESANH